MNEPASTCLPGSAASPLLPGLTECGQSPCAKSKATAGTFSAQTGQASRSTTTRKRSTHGNTKASGSSAAVHPASQPVLPGSSLARQITVGSGRKLSESLESASPLGSCLKILLESDQWDSTECLLAWKRKATKSGRSIFQLAPSIPRNDGQGSGLWGTPKTTRGDYQLGTDGEKILNLEGQLKTGLWATPRSSPSEFRTYKHCPTHGETHGELLCPQLNAAMWPSPTASLGSAGNNTRSGDRKDEMLMGGLLRSTFGATSPGSNAETESGGAPNPEFVAWLMGLPWDYLKHWETQSSGQSLLPLFGP
jgi:hypothetical protein